MCVHRESGAQRAVKVLRKSHMDEDEKRMLFNEINILKEIVSDFAEDLSDTIRSISNIAFLVIGYSPQLAELLLTLLSSARTTPISSRCTSSSRTRSATTWSPSKLDFDRFISVC